MLCTTHSGGNDTFLPVIESCETAAAVEVGVGPAEVGKWRIAEQNWKIASRQKIEDRRKMALHTERDDSTQTNREKTHVVVGNDRQKINNYH